MAIRQEQKLKTRTLLGHRPKQLLFVTLLRDRTFFDECRPQLSADKFLPEDRTFLILWRALCAYVDAYDSMPGAAQILAQLDATIDEHPGFLSDSDIVELDQLVRYAFDDISDDEIRPATAISYLRQYLEDQLSVAVRDIFSFHHLTPGDLPGVLERFQSQAEQIKALAESPLMEPFPEGEEVMVEIDKFSTSIDFIDHLLNGGQAASEVYGLMAPYGSCKTTLAVQLTTGYAALARNQWLQSGRSGPLKMVYLFSYEEPEESLKLRAISHVARIPREVLERGQWEKNLRRRGYQEYEERLFSDAFASNTPVPFEYERYCVAKQALNANWRMVDMTGFRGGRGGGGAEEAAAVIDHDLNNCRRRGIQAECGMVVVDYVGAAADAYIAANNLQRDKVIRHVIMQYIAGARRKLATAFNCPVWLLHQLNANANSLSPIKLPQRTDSAECRTFAQTLDFSFVAGNPDQEMRCLFGADKTRRARRQPPVVLHIDGDYCTVRDTGNQFIPDPATNSFVQRGMLHSVGGFAALSPEEPPPPQAASPGGTGAVRSVALPGMPAAMQTNVVRRRVVPARPQRARVAPADNSND